MAKTLTPAQKALNKEAVKLRNKAFSLAYQKHQQDRERVNAQIRESEMGKAHKLTDDIFQEALEAKQKAEKDIRDEIAKLQLKLKEVTERQEQQIKVLQAKRSLAHEALFKALRKAEKEVDEAHGDIAGCFSAAAWKPLEEFLPLVGKVNKS